jgi:NAD(P)-dependent dehydrogenase (short-subunit alcohol dehydrogenase family)
LARLAGKTVLITGGTSGIGYAAAELFRAEGARVAITGQDETRLADAARRLGDDVLALRIEMSALPEIDAMVSKVRDAFRQLDVLFVNAGVTWPAPLDSVDEAHFDGQIAINLKGPFFTVQKAAPLLRQGASVILTTSCLDEMGLAGMSVYSASKAALRSLARTVSAELSPRGIRVNAIAPGPVNTPIYGKLGMTAEQLEGFAADLKGKIPMRRFAEAGEIASAALFLASSDSSFMLGEEITIDGGWARL